MKRRFRRAAPPCARRPLPPPFEAVAEKCAYGGDAIARAPDGRVAFISGALPGERVAAEPYLDKKSFVKCRAARILEPSPDRTHTPASGVPGCVYGDFSYEAEIAAKKSQLEDFLAKAARAAGAEIAVPVAVHPSPSPLRYRNKTVLHAGFAPDGSRALGYMIEPSHRVFDLPACPLALPQIADAMPEVRRKVFADFRPGGNVTVRFTPHDGTVWWTSRGAPPAQPLVETVCGAEFEVAADGFWQVNPATGAALVRAVADRCLETPSAPLVDLYCGAGSFGIVCAREAALKTGRAPALTGLEISARAVECARRNAARNGISARFEAGPVAALLERAGVRPESTVVADPPRGGFEPGVARALAECGARRIMCVSCDPATLARDLAPLLENYSVGSAEMFDMFPRTARFETFLVLERRARPISCARRL